VDQKKGLFDLTMDKEESGIILHFEQDKEEIGTEIVQRDGTDYMRPLATSVGGPDTRINSTNCEINDL
jgi:hypothetical protein